MNYKAGIVAAAMMLLLGPAALPGAADDSNPRSLFGDRAVLRAGQVAQGDYVAFEPHVESSAGQLRIR
ncbi:MAG: hypothetical protein JSR62_11870 [Nitrospira sp.]|nr:hypothetical protein [Nitrospira sp.]